MQTCSVNTFQIKIPEELNRKIKSDAAQTGLTKHDWILKAIREQANRESEFNETLDLLGRAYRFVKGGPATKLEEDLKVYCELFSQK